MLALIKNSTDSIKTLIDFQKNPYLFFDQVKPNDLSHIKYLNMGFKNFYFCYHPDHAKYILQDNKDNYPKSDLVLKKILPLSGPTGLIQLKDKKAKPVRQSSGHLMHPDRAKRLSEYVSSFVEEEFDRLDQAARIGAVVDLKDFLTQLVLRTAGIFILNKDVQGQADDLNEAFVELNRMAGESLRSLFTFPYSPKRNKYLKVIHRELDKIIDEQLQSKDTSLLHELSKKNYPRSFIRDQVKAFMFAGYDTTASSLIFAVDSVARCKRSQNGIFSEKKLGYREAEFTQAAYKESLRLYPSAYFLPRQSIEDDIIGDQKIMAGSQLFISIRHVQRCPEVFEKPDQFIPERFLEKLNHSHGFIPFGGGARICIGAPLAMMEATVVLQKICERYEFEAAKESPPEIEGLITAHTKSPLYLRLKRRSSC